MIILRDPKIVFVPSRTAFFQWDDKTLEEKLKEGFKKAGGKDGAYFIKCPPDLNLTATVDDGEIEVSICSLVCDYYKVDKMSNETYKKFKSEIQDGVILLIYDDKTQHVDILRR